MVDWRAKAPRVPRTKKNKPLDVPLAPTTLVIHEGLRPSDNPKGPVFVSVAKKSNAKGEAFRNPRSWFTEAVREAGIKKCRWHDTRHDFAPSLRRQGVSLEDIAELLGHSSLSMTRRYAHPDFERLWKAVARLETT